VACPDPDRPTVLRLWVEKSFTVKPPALGVTMGETGNEYTKEPPAPPKSRPPGRPEKKGKVREFVSEALIAENDRIGNELCRECQEKLQVSKNTFWRAVNDMEEDGEIATDGGTGTGHQTVLHLVKDQN
jgi:hypothetical protein